MWNRVSTVAMKRHGAVKGFCGLCLWFASVMVCLLSVGRCSVLALTEQPDTLPEAAPLHVLLLLCTYWVFSTSRVRRLDRPVHTGHAMCL
jgi:hypothetical protein